MILTLVGEEGKHASMKVPPKRKGNIHPRIPDELIRHGLNESPSEKEGKSVVLHR